MKIEMILLHRYGFLLTADSDEELAFFAWFSSLGDFTNFPNTKFKVTKHSNSEWTDAANFLISRIA